jgi:signal transduction histidine kinase
MSATASAVSTARPTTTSASRSTSESCPARVRECLKHRGPSVHPWFSRSEAFAQGIAEALTDPHRLRLARTNLIENAIKFRPPGKRCVTSWWRGSEVGVTVSDEGALVSRSKIATISSTATTARKARRRVGGSGLGLAICQEVVVAHGGRPWLESPPGDGSTFSLALPG